MKTLSVDLENCFWIEKLKHNIEFNNNVALIYAQNWVMKTSYTNTFLCIQKWKENDIRDKIFWKTPVKHIIQIDWVDIKKDDIFVIESINTKYETNSLNDLLIDENIKSKLQSIIESKNNLINYFAEKSWLKKDDIEKIIINDFGWTNSNFLSNLNNLLDSPELNINNIIYSDILSVKDYILKKEFQENIQKYIEEMNSLFSNNEKFHYLEKWIFSIWNIKSLQKDLNKNAFFKKEWNKIIIWWEKLWEKELINVIELIDEEIKWSKSYLEISKLLSKSEKWIKFMNIIENNTQILPYLKKDKLKIFWKNIWLLYALSNRNEIEKLKNDYENIIKEIDNSNNNSRFDDALDIFNNRFQVPFSMNIDNKSDVILWVSSLPQVTFTFYKDWNKENKWVDNTVKIERKELDEKNILSKWEERALYLLNIILDIEKLKKDGKERLIIIDDIADSFDYKNKYAIIEYLRDIASYKNKNWKILFYLIILTHNFDFYRNVQLRLWAQELSYYIDKENEHLVFNDKLKDDPIKEWKKQLDEKHILAMIPLARNLFQYGKDINNYYNDLSALLHWKTNSTSFTIWELEKIFIECFNIKFSNIDKNKKVMHMLFEVADSIKTSNKLLEDKVVLSIAIRIKAEKYLKEQVWIIKNKSSLYPYIKKYETSDKMKKNNLKILNSVLIMTPENIHLNSFMYEPLIDMWIDELFSLYNKISNLD